MSELLLLLRTVDTVVRTDPFRELDRLPQQLTGPGTWSRPSPMPMDAYREGDEYMVAFDIPGVSADAIDIDVERNMLTVKAERRPAAKADDVQMELEDVDAVRICVGAPRRGGQWFTGAASKDRLQFVPGAIEPRRVYGLLVSTSATSHTRALIIQLLMVHSPVCCRPLEMVSLSSSARLL